MQGPQLTFQPLSPCTPSRVSRAAARGAATVWLRLMPDSTTA